MSLQKNISSIQDMLMQFDSISLDQLNQKAPLLHRRDRKFIFHISSLQQVIQGCILPYQILEVNAARCIPFQTSYYDTPDLLCYYDHHRGRSPRHKIRHRIYGEGHEHSLELKIKIAGFKTKKYRKHLPPNQIHSPELKHHIDFFNDCNISNIQLYDKKIDVRYHRITFINKSIQEKITIDLGLSFHAADIDLTFDQLVIAEIKSEDLSNSHFSQLMRSLHIPEGGISKYCLGMISLFPNIKFNNFKPILRRIQKLKSYDIDTADRTSAGMERS